MESNPAATSFVLCSGLSMPFKVLVEKCSPCWASFLKQICFKSHLSGDDSSSLVSSLDQMQISLNDGSSSSCWVQKSLDIGNPWKIVFGRRYIFKVVWLMDREYRRNISSWIFGTSSVRFRALFHSFFSESVKNSLSTSKWSNTSLSIKPKCAKLSK